MLKLFSNLKVSQKILLANGLLFLNIIVVIGGSFIVLQLQRFDAVKINLAGRQRMLTQKMMKEAEKFTSDVQDMDKNTGDYAGQQSNLAKTVRLFDETLSALMNGGKAATDLNMTKFVSLPPCKDKEIYRQLSKVKELWNKFKENIDMLQGKSANVDISFIRSHNMELLKEMNKAVGMMQRAANHKIDMLRGFMVLSFLISIIIFAFSFLISSSIVRPINEVKEKLIVSANGDLSQRITDIDTNDEIGEMVKAFNSFMDDVGRLIKTAKGSANSIISFANTLSSMVEQLSGSIQAQTGQANNIASATEEMNATVKEIANATREAKGKSDEARDKAIVGAKNVDALLVEMDNVVRVDQAFAEQFNRLNEDSSQVSSVIVVINDIVDKINLLALNAAIEAARAGEAGRGFSVVAEEIRKLAEKTKDSTQEIKSVITGIQEDIANMSGDVVRNVGIIQQTTEKAKEVGDMVRDIRRVINELNDFMNQVVTATDEQSIATEEISKSITRISGAFGEHFEAIKVISGDMGNLSQAVEELNVLINKFIV